MKAYLIDPIQRTVEEVSYSGDSNQLRELIGCQYFEAHRINSLGDFVFVDEEAMLRPGPLPAFRHKDWQVPLVGRGVVLGLGRSGKEREPRCQLEELRKAVSYGTLMRAPDEIAELLVKLVLESERPPNKELH